VWTEVFKPFVSAVAIDVGCEDVLDAYDLIVSGDGAVRGEKPEDFCIGQFHS
jgi:hypothetical protein